MKLITKIPVICIAAKKQSKSDPSFKKYFGQQECTDKADKRHCNGRQSCQYHVHSHFLHETRWSHGFGCPDKVVIIYTAWWLQSFKLKPVSGASSPQSPVTRSPTNSKVATILQRADDIRQVTK